MLVVVVVVPVLVVLVALSVLTARSRVLPLCPELVEVVWVMLSTLLVIVPLRRASSRAVAGEAITTADDRPAPNATVEASTDMRRPAGTN